MPLSSTGSDLLRYKKNLSVFIETGTADGDGIQSAINAGFEEIYSIELSEDLYNRAKERFADNPNVHLIRGSSEIELPKLLTTTKQPFLLWLDAHASGGQYIGELMYHYLPKELKSILDHSSLFKNCVIMIDDMNYYIDDTVFVNEVESLVTQLKPNGTIEYHKGHVVQHNTLILVSK